MVNVWPTHKSTNQKECLKKIEFKTDYFFINHRPVFSCTVVAAKFLSI